MFSPVAWRCLSLCPFSLFLFSASFAQLAFDVRGDDSDWWSQVRAENSADLSANQTKTQHRALAPSNFEIEGIRLQPGVVRQAADKLGKLTIVARGDASESRIQACYVQTATARKTTHLIFEEDGEGFGGSFYLFSDARPWNGSNLCAKSPLVSENVATAAGLHLGMTPAEVESILGKPSTSAAGELTYVLETRNKTAPEKLKKLRAQDQDMSDKDFHDSYDFFYVDVFVLARFSDSKLSYFGITKSETYP
jgi:hypothetical protein